MNEFLTLGQPESENINQLITITGRFHQVIFSKWDVSNVITLHNDYI